MSRRLQVLLEEDEFEDYQRMAEAQGKTLSSWVRGALQAAGRDAPAIAREKKLAAIERACAFDAPAPPIDTMKREIELGVLKSIQKGLPEGDL